MPRPVKPLTIAKVKNAKPGNKPIKLSDGGGLYLLISPTGKKGWRFKYSFHGKEQLISFGTYPEISLSEAREKRLSARKQVLAGVNPSEVRKSKKRAQGSHEESFEVVAREWHSKFSITWSDNHAQRILTRLEKDVFPWLGEKPVNAIKAPDILMVLRRVESRGALETAHRIRTVCGQVFRYAVATGRAERDPSADLKGTLPPTKKKHLAAITDPEKVKGLLNAIDDFEGSFIVKCALRLAPLTFVRPGELRKAEWSEFNLDAAEWNIPAERMKMKEPHLVPLSKQAVEILKELLPLTGQGRYLFHSIRSTARPMSDNTMNAALRRMGYERDEMTAHGFRAMARTILDEVLQVRPDLIEHQLAHAVRDPLGRAYNRTTHIVERTKMMQTWADYLDELKAHNKATPLQRST